MDQVEMNKISFLLVIVLLIMGGYFAWDIWNNPKAEVPSTERTNVSQSPATTINKDEYTGKISTNDNGKNSYINNRYNFKFTYPQEWRVGDNSLGYGTFQLFNYPESIANGKSSFSPDNGMNKIEAGISASGLYGSSDDYPEKTRTAKEIEIAGQTAIRTEVELAGGERILSYVIPLPIIPQKSLSITIYGDPSNFRVLDEIIASFEWVQ
ncbi:MAG: hypothetical protein NUV49_00020 [Patescibacteria group bacterium]|nr:hypothetical protein [Patescibacteria group bacterium]